MQSNSLFSVVVAAVISGQALGEAPKESQVQWVKEHAIPLRTVEAGSGFEDLQPLKGLIGDARIVSLGECTHGSREVFQMRHRLVEFLATEMGFTVFAIESGMPESHQINDYVLGRGGDPKQLIDGMGAWVWTTEEVLDMVEWMRHFNATNTGRIEFTGFDMQEPQLAMDNVVDFLRRHDAGLHTRAMRMYDMVKRATKRGFRESGLVIGHFPVDQARGKRVTFSGWIKTEDVQERPACLWWSAKGKDGKRLAFDAMEGRGPTGAIDWTRFSINIDVPLETQDITFGVMLLGKGKAWFDGLEIELDGREYQNARLFDFDFESDEVKGLTPQFRTTYRTRLDNQVAKTGKQSLLLESVGDESPDALPAAFGLKLARQVLASLEQASDDLLKNADEKELEWTLQNARIVYQCMERRADRKDVLGRAVRDRCMADNVAWILDNKPQARIILWAHNGHVAKENSKMGQHLGDMFGPEYLAVAFSTSTGNYRASNMEKETSVHVLQTPPEGSVEEVFHRTGVPRFVLDLREATEDSEASGWLVKPTPFRHIGALARNKQFRSENLRQIYDTVIHIDQTTATRPLITAAAPH